jgi:DNA-binding NtrC family response regulator
VDSGPWLHADDDAAAASEGIRAALAASGIAVREWSGKCEQSPGVVVFSDVSPALLELVRFASDAGRFPLLAVAAGPVAVLAARRSGWTLLEWGAADILTLQDPAEVARDLASRLAHWRRIEAMVNQPDVAARCIGMSPAWKRVLTRIVEAAAGGDAPILLIGESGTGKEVLARLIHDLDPRTARQNLVVVDCTTVARELSGSELFGHVRGAFTGAHGDREGAFALADGGTLFLDEVGELPPAMQAELLRVVQEKVFKSLGSNVWRRSEFRLVAATHRPLEQDVAAGKFRHDLYHRLAGWRIELPPLRERPEDIPALADYFVKQFAAQGTPPPLAPEVAEFLAAHPFPGNVRQLRNVIQRMMLRYPGTGPISLGLISPEDRPPATADDDVHWLGELEAAAERAAARGVQLKDFGRQAEDCIVRFGIRNEAGNLHRAALRLGISDRALQLRIASKRALGATGPAATDPLCRVKLPGNVPREDTAGTGDGR